MRNKQLWALRPINMEDWWFVFAPGFSLSSFNGFHKRAIHPVTLLWRRAALTGKQRGKGDAFVAIMIETSLLYRFEIVFMKVICSRLNYRIKLGTHRLATKCHKFTSLNPKHIYICLRNTSRVYSILIMSRVHAKNNEFLVCSQIRCGLNNVQPPKPHALYDRAPKWSSSRFQSRRRPHLSISENPLPATNTAHFLIGSNIANVKYSSTDSANRIAPFAATIISRNVNSNPLRLSHASEITTE